MKLGIVGCGAVGSYYGAMLCRAGQEVHFLLRSDYEHVRRNGIRVFSPKGDFHTRPHCAATPEKIGVCDCVLVALKTTANEMFARLLPPLVGPHTAVVTLQNGLGNEEALAKIFPPEQIMGGLCFVCLNRTAPGVVRHLDHGLIVLGEFQRGPEPRTHDLAATIRHSGVSCKVTDNLARAHWEKLVWNIPFNGLGVASCVGYEALVNSPAAPAALLTSGNCLTTDRLLADSRWETLVRELMLEVISVANALGLGVSESLAEKQIERTRTMGAYKASTILDFEQGRPLELESLFLEPLRQAQQARVETPRLTALCSLLRQLNSRRI